jgi:hypothetical protein
MKQPGKENYIGNMLVAQRKNPKNLTIDLTVFCIVPKIELLSAHPEEKSCMSTWSAHFYS